MARTYTTVGTVCSSTLLWCLVDLDVLDNKVAGVKTLAISVGLGVLEETEKELGGLDWPSGAGDTELLACNRIPIRSCPKKISPSHVSLEKITIPCAARPVPPAYRLMATASLCSLTFSKNLTARSNFHPLIA